MFHYDVKFPTFVQTKTAHSQLRIELFSILIQAGQTVQGLLIPRLEEHSLPWPEINVQICFENF